MVDECHHARRDHPLAKVLARHWRSSSQATQLLGLSAAPASRSSLVATVNDMLALRDTLQAEYLTVDPNNEELQVPAAR